MRGCPMESSNLSWINFRTQNRAGLYLIPMQLLENRYVCAFSVGFLTQFHSVAGQDTSTIGGILTNRRTLKKGLVVSAGQIFAADLEVFQVSQNSQSDL